MQPKLPAATHLLRVLAERVNLCRMRRASFPFDTSYPGEPLPTLAIEIRSDAGMPGVVLDRVIADTGADASAFPWSDCQQLQLDPALG